MNVCDKQHIAAQARADYLVRPGAVLALIRLFTRNRRMYQVGLPIASIFPRTGLSMWRGGGEDVT